MDKPRGLLVQTIAKRLVLLLGLGLFLGLGPRSFAWNDELGVLNQQESKLFQQGKYQQAIPVAEKLLSTARRELGPEDPDTVVILYNLAVLYDEMGDYAKAEPLYQQALQIRKKTRGPAHPDTADSLEGLGVLYVTMGDYARAEPLLEQALQIKRKALGPKHLGTATSLNHLADLYEKMGDYARAEPLFEQALQIRKALSPEDRETATSLAGLAGLYRDMGDYARAEPLLEQALKIRKKALGPNHPVTAESLDGLARLYELTGDYARAEPLYQQAFEIRKKVFGPEHPQMATSLDELASLYRLMGDYARAELFYQQALQITQKAFGPVNPETATSLANLANLYLERGDYEKAEPLIEQALQIEKKVLGPEHPNTASTLESVARLYEEMGDYPKAEPLFQQAFEIRKKVFGSENPDTAKSLAQLGGLYALWGDCAKAESLVEQALHIDQKAFGPEHPQTASDLQGLGLIKFDLGQILEAKSLAQLSAKANLAVLSNILSFTSEQQRLAYEDDIDPYSLLSVTRSEAELTSAVLRYKCVILDSLIEDRLMAEASKETQDRDWVGRLTADKRQLGQLLLQTPNQPSGEINKKIENLEQEVEQIEGQLAQHVSGLGRARRALSVSVDQVQSVIPVDGALIEYLLYWQYLGKLKWEPRYGAIVLAATGPPCWIPLGSAKEVGTTVSRYQRLVRSASNPGELSENLEVLWKQLWGPIERALPPDVRRVIISPDGQLNFVSFATLLDAEERFLTEKYTVQYATSGRDLLREVQTATRTDAVVFANPEFTLSTTPAIAQADGELSNAAAGTLRGSEKRDVEHLSFGSLEGTQKECDKLTKTFEEWHWKTDSFTGKDATKQALLKVHSPYILHLATHGFFEAADQSATKSIEHQPVGFERSVTNSKFFKTPMHRSGLALAGAQTTMEAWKRGEAPAVENDGIVTAEDVAALDLKGTWLVTLSACDTGSGEAKAGEGVMGLRRGFLQAGTQHLLMTLWPISDETTVQIMTDFYDSARRTANPAQALADVQRDWLIKIRKQHGLAEAVRLAGPFILSSQGKP